MDIDKKYEYIVKTSSELENVDARVGSSSSELGELGELGWEFIFFLEDKYWIFKREID